VRARLEGFSVAIVRTADVSAADAESTTSRLTEANATVGADVALTDEWSAEDRGPFRAALAEQITLALAEPPVGATTEEILAAALAEALAPGVAEGESIVSPESQERADTLWSLLLDSGLVTGDRTENSTMVVLVAGGDDVEALSAAFAKNSLGTVVGFTGAATDTGAGVSIVTNAATFYGAWAVVGAAINASGSITGAYDASDADELLGALTS
jgi:hypothetical protein